MGKTNLQLETEQRSWADKRVPKCNLGTRRTSQISAGDFVSLVAAVTTPIEPSAMIATMVGMAGAMRGIRSARISAKIGGVELSAVPTFAAFGNIIPIGFPNINERYGERDQNDNQTSAAHNGSNQSLVCHMRKVSSFWAFFKFFKSI
jgi:hypothetical protein